MKTIRFVRPLFFLFITLLIFYLISQKVNFVSLRDVFLNVRWHYLILAALGIFSTLIFGAKKWQAILRAMDYSVSFKDSFRVIMAASPLSVVTPAKAGELVRAYYLKDRIPITQVMGGVLTERFIDVAILAFYSFLGAVFFKNWLILGISLFIIFLIPLFFLIVNKIKLPFGKWRDRVDGLLHVSRIFIKKPQKLFTVLSYGVFLWLLTILSVKILFLSLGFNVPLFYVAAAFPIAIFISLLPVTIAGMGTRDSAIIYFFSPFAGASVSLGVGILYSIFAYWLVALIGLPFMKKSL